MRLPRLSCILVALSLAATAALAQAQEVLRLDGTVDAEVLMPAAGVLEDPDRAFDVEDVLSMPFARVDAGSVDFGYTKSAIWLRFDLENGTRDLSEWRLHLRENFLQGFAVWQVAPGAPPRLLDRHTMDTPFRDRALPAPELAVPVTLPPGDRTTLILRYWSGGSSELTAAFRSQADYEAQASVATAKNFTFYGMMSLLVFASLVLWVATGQGVFGAYSAYALMALLFVMHGDGNAFAMLWPDWPRFNADASIFLGAGLIAAGANYARQFLQTAQYHPVMDRILIAAISACIAMAAASFVVDTQTIKKYLVLMALGGALLFVSTALVAARTRFREVRFYVIAWAGAVLSALLMTGRHWFGIEISESTQYDSMRVVFVVDAALMGFAILDRFNQLKRNRQAALEASLTEARRNLALSTRLTELERQYALAEELAQSRERHLADTVHDLRQPLHALRLNVQALVKGSGEGPGADEMERSFAYLEGIVGRELEGAGPARPAAPGASQDPALSVGAVLAAVHEMFLPDAAAKGLDLRRVGSSAASPVPPLALMRIATNLVSNAVKYTEAGRVLIGVRHGGAGGLRLEVHDTGPGMDTGAFARASARAARLPGAEAAPGTGLGLAIVHDLAEEHGLSVRLVPGRAGGTGIAVTLRPAEERAAAE